MRLAVLLALGAALLAASPALAEGDYAAGSTAWNGLSALAGEARAQSCTLVPTSRLDWSSLDGSDALWFVYPRVPIDTRKLERWLSGGGRAVIADDFGAAGPALEALGIHRSSAPPEVPPAARYQHNAELPEAYPRLETELGRSAPALTANHAAWFRSAIPATFELAPGEALVIEGRLGAGYFVALADPSVLINNMLELDEDRAFARALIARTCRPGGRILLVTSTFVSGGEPPGTLAQAPSGSPFQRFNQGLRGFDGWVRAGEAAVPPWTIACFFALAAIGLLLDLFPAHAPLGDRFTRFVPDEGPLGAPLDYGLEAAIVREEATQRLAAALGEAPSPDGPQALDRLGPQALGEQVSTRAGARAGRAAAELWRLLHRIRWRSLGPGGEPTPDQRIDRRLLLRLHQLAVELFAALENPEPPSEV